jgi:Fe2+ transport system protein FeoA
MKDGVENCPAELVFHLDEVRFSEWEDRKDKKVMAPVSTASQTVHHAVSRNVKHLSIVMCISASGACLTPYILSSQATGPVQQRLVQTGFRSGRAVIFQQRPRADLNGPHLMRVRTQNNLLDEEAVRLMGNCPSHLMQEVLGLLNNARVRIVTFAPHTTHPFQVLDLILFGIFKGRQKYQLPFEDDNDTVAFIEKEYQGFRTAMIDTNIRAAFRHIGVTFHMLDDVMRVQFNGETLRERSGFPWLRLKNIPLEALSARRRGSPFG